MTPKEKAEELINKFKNVSAPTRQEYCEKIALISADETWKAVSLLCDETEDFWLDVKIQLDKL